MACDEVRVRYGGIEVLHGVRLAAAYGTFAALVGPNGAGKTTLLDWCAGAATEAFATGGRLRLFGDDATSWSAARRARAGLRYVPFERNVFPGLSVLDNLRATRNTLDTHDTYSARATSSPRSSHSPFGSHSPFDSHNPFDSRNSHSPHGPNPAHSTVRASSAGLSESSGRPGVSSPADSALELFPELARLARRSAALLSGGERQLLAVACALHGPGSILLLDEPTHGLAPDLADRVLAELARTAHEDGRAVLIAEPSADKLTAHTDFLWPLDRGHRTLALGA
jgi:ABC-type branched-subunit amino acid transport system ATPase component